MFECQMKNNWYLINMLDFGFIISVTEGKYLIYHLLSSSVMKITVEVIGPRGRPKLRFEKKYTCTCGKHASE